MGIVEHAPDEAGGADPGPAMPPEQVVPPGPGATAVPQATEPAGEPGTEPAGEPHGAPRDSDGDGGSVGQQSAAPASELTELLRITREAAAAADRYHSRAEQRESVIDHLHAEVERLRRGERRGLLRPLLVQLTRLRNDLLRQAAELPPDYDAERASVLLRSFADSVELSLEDSGVVTFCPQPGDPFDPRMHRRVGGEPSAHPGQAGQIAGVQRSGYLDVDSGTPIAPAEVVVYAAAPVLPAQNATGHRVEQSTDPAGPIPEPVPVPEADERKQL
jgi:molecular chaperone GrpE (heat shock protein)